MLIIFKELTYIKWGNQKELILSIFQTITGTILEYETPYGALSYHQEASNHSEQSFLLCCWLHMRHNTQHLHDKTNVFLIGTHLKLHAIQLKQLTQTMHIQIHPET